MLSNVHVFRMPLLTKLDPTDKSLLTVYVITVDNFGNHRFGSMISQTSLNRGTSSGNVKRFISNCTLCLDVVSAETPPLLDKDIRLISAFTVSTFTFLISAVAWNTFNTISTEASYTSFYS